MVLLRNGCYYVIAMIFTCRICVILSFGAGGALKFPEFPPLSRLLEDLTETFLDFLSGDRLRPRFRSCRLSTRLDILQK